MQWKNTTDKDYFLTLTTTIHTAGDASYSLDGSVIDEEGKPFAVGEFSFNRDRIEQSATYYARNFDNVRIIRATTWE